MELLAKWGLAIAFAGVALSTCVQFCALSSEQKRKWKYKIGFIISLILIAVGTVIQQIAINKILP
jgi:predicted nucleic acid-binding Zn ribbon protein